MRWRAFNKKTMDDLYTGGLRRHGWTDDDLTALDHCVNTADDERDRHHAHLTSTNLPVLIQAGFFPDRNPRVIIDWVTAIGSWRLTEHRAAAEGKATPRGTDRYLTTRDQVRAWTGLLGGDGPAGYTSMSLDEAKDALAAGTLDRQALRAALRRRGEDGR